MSPINPNFKPGVGHLVTDRYDFQKHIDGEDFRHEAGSIDLNPAILIGSTLITDVQTAIAALSGSIIVPSVPDATTASKGIIQLNGDLFGSGTTALNPRVSGLQGTPISVFSGLALNQVLTWNGASWINQAVPGSISIAGDLAGVGSTLSVPRVGGLQGFAVSSASPVTGQALVWNGSVWLPTGIPTSPTGTGFATLTGGTYDAAATANIRYAAGKFQTDANLQYLNAGITGDLAWAPTASNKTLTLPNATDTLVGQSTTDTLINKNINATNNTITDTGTLTGDLLVSNGTKFLRFAQGVNGSFLGVSGGVLGYFTPASSTPTGTGFPHITGGVYDPTATVNIRYTGGKFQSDVNMQFKSGGNTGDLAWPSITLNRTISIPDATDTLVGKATLDILTNKTINATNNTITDTSTAVGDILKSNGTSFVRFARGAALQVLRTNTGATDLEWATVSFPPTYVSINQTGAGQLNNIFSDSNGDLTGNPAVCIRFTGDGAATDILLSGIQRLPLDSTNIRRIVLMSTSTSKLILSNLDPNSSSNNQIKFFGSASTTYVVGPDGYSCELMYDSTSLKWRLLTDLRALEYGVS